VTRGCGAIAGEDKVGRGQIGVWPDSRLQRVEHHVSAALFFTCDSIPEAGRDLRGYCASPRLICETPAGPFRPFPVIASFFPKHLCLGATFLLPAKVAVRIRTDLMDVSKGGQGKLGEEFRCTYLRMRFLFDPF